MSSSFITAPDLITLNCLIYGDLSENIFSITISKNLSIGVLKKHVKIRNSPLFDDIPATKLTLWRVSLPADNDVALEDLVLKNDNADMQKLLPLDELSDIFPETPIKNQIHIIVQKSEPERGIQCHASYGASTVSFRWMVPERLVTMAAFKEHLRLYLTFPDGTKDENISISQEVVNDKENSLTHILNDAELAHSLFENSAKDVSFVINTAQQPFSSWTFANIKPLLGITASCFMELPQFHADLAEVSPTHLDFVIEDILRKHKSTFNIISINEATRSEFISSVIYSVAAHYDGDVKVIPQLEISSIHGKGPIDWAIKTQDRIIGVTKAKYENIDQGVGQNVIQLQASLQSNRKRSYDDAMGEQETYGIVSTAVDWVIIKVVSNGTGKDGTQVFLSSLPPSSLPLSNSILTRDMLYEPIKKLVSQIKWVFDQQIGSPKRLRVAESSE